jgi:hypothetical protein
MDFSQLLKDFGPLVTLMVFVVWSGWQRERSGNKRISSHEKWEREVLVGLVERSTQVIGENNVILTGVKQVIQENGLVLQRMAQIIEDGKQKS